MFQFEVFYIYLFGYYEKRNEWAEKMFYNCFKLFWYFNLILCRTFIAVYTGEKNARFGGKREKVKKAGL